MLRSDSNGERDRDGDRCCGNGVETGTGIARMGTNTAETIRNGDNLLSPCSCLHVYVIH